MNNSDAACTIVEAAKEIKELDNRIRELTNAQIVVRNRMQSAEGMLRSIVGRHAPVKVFVVGGSAVVVRIVSESPHGDNVVSISVIDYIHIKG